MSQCRVNTLVYTRVLRSSRYDLTMTIDMIDWTIRWDRMCRELSGHSGRYWARVFQSADLPDRLDRNGVAARLFMAAPPRDQWDRLPLPDTVEALDEVVQELTAATRRANLRIEAWAREVAPRLADVNRRLEEWAREL